MDERAGMDVLGRVPSGLYILTLAGKSQNHGMLASWITQAGFSPPALVLAIKQDRPILRDLKAGVVFCLSLLAQDHAESKALMAQFARGFDIGQDAFANQAMASGAFGGHYFCGALGYMECRMLRMPESSTDHTLIVGEIIGGAMLRVGEPWIHVRRTGASY